MDKIEFKITDVQLENSNLKTYDIQVVLNGKTLTEKLFNTCQVLAASNFKNAEFDLFTCECGYAACAGFNEPVVQTQTNNSVKWKFPNDKSYDVEKLEFEFEKSQFKKVIKDIKNKVLKLEEEKSYPIDMISDTYEEIDQYEVRSSIKNCLENNEKNYQAKQNLQDLLNKHFPQLTSKQFQFQYENYQSSLFSLNYLVCRIINQFPAINNSNDFEDKIIEAGKAIEKTQANECHDFYKIIHNNTGKFNVKDKNDVNESVLNMYISHLYNLTQEKYDELEKNFDIKNMIIRIV